MRVELRGGPRDGEVCDVNGYPAYIMVPEYLYWCNQIIVHKYDANTGEWLSMTYPVLSEPNVRWTVDPFPRWTQFKAWVRHMRSLRLVAQGD